MKLEFKKGYAYTVIFMFVISAVFTAFLASANAFFLPTIRQNQELAEKKSILYAMGLTFPKEASAIEKSFDASVRKTEISGLTVYEKLDDSGKITGYAVPFSGSGLWGTIRGYVAVSSSLDQLLGVDFTSHSETPGLGGRIDEAWFKEQFRGMPIRQGEKLVYEPDKNGIDGISGASITSGSIERILKNLVENTLSQWEVKP